MQGFSILHDVSLPANTLFRELARSLDLSAVLGKTGRAVGGWTRAYDEELTADDITPQREFNHWTVDLYGVPV